MAKLYFVGIVERGEDGFYLSFPDLPGCVTAGASMQEAALHAESAVAMHIQGMLEDGLPLPAPTAADAIEADPEVHEVARLIVGVPIEEKAVRINVMLPSRLLAAIDAVSGNRSRFLSDAAKARLRALNASDFDQLSAV